MKSLENITKERGSNTEIMPKDIWQLYGWLFFEPKLLERINTYVAKHESVPAYLSRLVFYNIAFCVTLWLLLGCLTVLTYPNIRLFGEGVEQQPYNFLEKYKVYLVNSAWVFILPVYNLRNLLYKLGNSYDIINVLFLFYASVSAIFLANVSPITAFLVSIASFGAHYFSYKEENEYDRTRLTYRHHTLLLLFLFFVAIVSYVLYYNYMVELLKKDIETYALIYIYIYLLLLVYVPFLLFTMIYGRQFFLAYYNYLYYSRKMSFDKHPYLIDGYIFYINDTIDKFIVNMYYQKYDEPQIFLDFMAEHRPRASKIIKTMRYAIVARNIEENVFEEHTIRDNITHSLEWTEKGIEWYRVASDVQDKLLDFTQESHIVKKLEALNLLGDRIKEWARINNQKMYDWYWLYEKGISEWLKELEGRKEQIIKGIKEKEPLGENVYRPNKKLYIENEKIFVGREKLKTHLKYVIDNATKIPCFLLHGQRRVGKSSFTSFLQKYLGHGFIVVTIDLQGVIDSHKTVYMWISTILRMVEDRSNASQTDLLQEGGWANAWKTMGTRLKELACEKNKKIVIVFDEYELIEKLLITNKQEAEDLFRAMRSDNQGTNEFAFMFVGQVKMSNLRLPWNTYFPEKEFVEIGYLTWEDTKKLTEAYPSITYTEEAIQHLYHLTQGHPALLQSILFNIVEEANILHTHITANDKQDDFHLVINVEKIDTSVKKTILIEENGVIELFWADFSREINYDVNPTILQIVEEQIPTDEKAVHFLKGYGFIERKGEKYSFYVPLFQMWLKEYARFQ